MLIYILSRHSDSYSTKRLFEVAKLNGHQVRIIDHMKCELKIGFQSHIFYQGEKLKKPDYIIPRIGSSATFYGSNVLRQFEMMKVKTVVSAEGLLKSRDKLRASQNMVFNNIEVPKTYFPAPYQENFQYMINQVGGIPLIVKLLEGTQGLGVYLLENKNEAKKILEKFNLSNTHYLLQEYIAESKGTDVRAFVVGGKVVAAMKRIASEGEFRSNIHRGGRGEQVELTSAEKFLAIKTARILNLDVAGIDILQSNRGPLVLEVNSSPGLEGIEKYTDIDIAKAIVEYIESN
ncbi:MAG: RimK family alpha-L-glutamate ligase [Flavobacteriales bacterium]